MIPKQKKPTNAALRWVAGLMGRMDRHLASVIPGLAAALAPKPLPKCHPFHKRPGYVKREHADATTGLRYKRVVRKSLAAIRKGRNEALHAPNFSAERKHKQALVRVDYEGKSYTLTGRSQFPDDEYHFVAPNGTFRRMWTAGVSTPQRTPA